MKITYSDILRVKTVVLWVAQHPKDAYYLLEEAAIQAQQKGFVKSFKEDVFRRMVQN